MQHTHVRHPAQHLLQHPVQGGLKEMEEMQRQIALTNEELTDLQFRCARVF